MSNAKEMEKAEARFQNHVASVVLHTDDFLIIDWRDKSGSGNYFVRYYLDIKRGSFIVSGDLGDAVATWYNEVGPADLYRYINSVGYFLEKIQCSTDKYVYDVDDILSDLREYKTELIRDLEIEDTDEIDSDFETLEDYFAEHGKTELMIYSDDILEIFEKYASEWWESPFESAGQRISERVYLWIAGYRMACRQLGIV